MIRLRNKRFREAEGKRRRRQAADTCFIAVTGSHGKTTATALLGAILNRHRPTHIRQGPNSSQAVMRSLRYLQPWLHRYCVQEVSGNYPGAIDNSFDLLRPSIGIVTAVGGDHRSNFRSLEATAEEKSRLVHRLPTDGLAILNGDDPHVAAMAEGCVCPVRVYGTTPDADLRLLEAKSRWPERLQLKVSFRGDSFSVHTQFVGVHWAVSVMAALLTALELGVSRDACQRAIEAFTPIGERSSVHHKPGGPWFVLDTQKAPFPGIEACLAFLADAHASRKTVVFGTISDYPGASRRHYERAAVLALNVADRVIFVGPNAPRVRRLADGEYKGRLTYEEDLKDVQKFLSLSAVPGELVYMKSSRADALHSLFSNRLSIVDCLVGDRFGRLGCRPYLLEKIQALFSSRSIPGS